MVSTQIEEGQSSSSHTVKETPTPNSIVDVSAAHESHRPEFHSSSDGFLRFKGASVNCCVSIISDEEDLRNAVPWVLQLMGCQRTKAYEILNPSVATEILNSDLVLCDVAIGLQCISAMYEAAVGGPIPRVALIVDIPFNKELVSKCLEAGADCYVMKPIRIQALRGLVAQCVSEPSVASAPKICSSEAVDRASYQKNHCIGSGAVGQVWLVQRKRDGANFALKETDVGKLNFNEQQRVLNEMRLHRSFCCPCIVQTYSSWLQERSAYLLMEYVRHGTLRDLVKHHKENMTQIDDWLTLEWGAQIFLALLYLHNKAVLHRDVKLENILGPDAHNCVKLTDFGVSKQIVTRPVPEICLQGEIDESLSFVGTHYIMSPERVSSSFGSRLWLENDGRESDLWSLGVVLYELIALKPPFGELDSDSGFAHGSQTSDGADHRREMLFEQISSKSPEPLPYCCDAGLHKIVTGGLLQKNPKDRPTASDLCADRTLGNAMLSFLKRRKLLNHPAVLEVLDVSVTPDHLGHQRERVECSDVDVVSLYSQRSGSKGSSGNSRFGKELLARAKPAGEAPSTQIARDESWSLKENYNEQFMGVDKGLEEQLARMASRNEQLHADIQSQARELEYMKRPVEAAQRQSDLIAAYVRRRDNGILHPCSLRFVKNSVEVEYTYARRQRVASRVAIIGAVAASACIGRLAAGERLFWPERIMGRLVWSMQRCIICVALAMSLVAVLFSQVILRTSRQMLFLGEFLTVLLLHMCMLIFIFVHDPIYLLALSELFVRPDCAGASSPCHDRVCNKVADVVEDLPVHTGAIAPLVIALVLAFLPAVVPVRYIIQLTMSIVLFPLCTLVELTASGALACRSSSDGSAFLRLALLCTAAAVALLAKRHSDRAERFQCLLTRREITGQKKGISKHKPGNGRGIGLRSMSNNSLGSLGFTSQKRKSLFAKTRSWSRVTLSDIVSARDKFFAAAARTISRSGLALGEKNLERGATTHSEAIFQAYEEADDEITRAISLVSIEDTGVKERWLLDSDSVRMSPNCKSLGKGGFGVVMEGELYGTPIAIKLPGQQSGEAMDRNRNKNNLGNELRVLRHVWHPNIVVFYGCTIDLGSQEIMLILERLKGEQLDDFCCRRERPPSTAMRHKLLIDICSALRSLHGLNPRVVHGDLKGSNILVELWHSGPRAKLLDFGLSRLLTSHVSPLGGTVRWMAPEVIRHRTDSPAPAADVFSFGRLAYLVVTGKQPLRRYSCEAIVQAVQRSHILPLSWPRRGPLVDEARSLAERCHMMKAYMRPDMDAVFDFVKTWQVPQDAEGRTTIHGSTIPVAPLPQGPCVAWQEGINAIISQAHSQETVKLSQLRALWIRFSGAHNERDVDFMSTLMKEASSHGRLIAPSRIKVMTFFPVNAYNNASIVTPGIFDGYLTALRIPRTHLSGSAADSIGLDLIKLELQALLHVKHPNIASFHGLCFAPQHCRVIPVLEWVEGVSLRVFSRPPPTDPDQETRLRILLDVCSALCYLHSRRPPVVHGMLNCDNVLIEARLAGPRAKILDVGFTRTLLRYSLRSSWRPAKLEQRICRRRKSLGFMAPELLCQRNAIQHYDPSADVFSLGRLCYLVVCGRVPFEDVETSMLERAARRGEVVPLTWPVQQVPLQHECEPIVESCLSLAKVARPNIRDMQKDMLHWLDKSDSELQEPSQLPTFSEQSQLKPIPIRTQQCPLLFGEDLTKADRDDASSRSMSEASVISAPFPGECEGVSGEKDEEDKEDCVDSDTCWMTAAGPDVEVPAAVTARRIRSPRKQPLVSDGSQRSPLCWEPEESVALTDQIELAASCAVPSPSEYIETSLEESAKPAPSSAEPFDQQAFYAALENGDGALAVRLSSSLSQSDMEQRCIEWLAAKGWHAGLAQGVAWGSTKSTCAVRKEPLRKL